MPDIDNKDGENLRTRKFRAWNILDSTWNYFYIPHDFFTKSLVPEQYSHWGEFTGYLDKNGAEIFEGDTVKWGEEDGLQSEVRWSENGQGWLPHFNTKTEIIRQRS